MLDSKYSLAFVFKATTTYGDGFACYEEEMLYVGETMGGGLYLTGVYPVSLRKTDYTVEAIKELRLKVNSTEKIFDDLKSSLNQFGRYDR